MPDSLNLISALSISQAIHGTWSFLLKGGVFMIPLGITSIAGMTAVLYKALSLTRSRIIPGALARQVQDFQELAAADQIAPALKEFEQGRSTLARLAAVAYRNRGKTHQEITSAVEAAAREETTRMHAGIGVLDVVITIAPLLGLLGTAAGLVEIFEGLSEAADYLVIAKGIAVAMTTTITGLAIAVPCVIAHGVFTRKIDVLTARLESLLAVLASACQKTGTKS
jgi:biopolymer transport protein ExbB